MCPQRPPHPEGELSLLPAEETPSHRAAVSSDFYKTLLHKTAWISRILADSPLCGGCPTPGVWGSEARRPQWGQHLSQGSDPGGLPRRLWLGLGPARRRHLQPEGGGVWSGPPRFRLDAALHHSHRASLPPAMSHLPLSKPEPRNWDPRAQARSHEPAGLPVHSGSLRFEGRQDRPAATSNRDPFKGRNAGRHKRLVYCFEDTHTWNHCPPRGRISKPEGSARCSGPHPPAAQPDGLRPGRLPGHPRPWPRRSHCP